MRNGRFCTILVVHTGEKPYNCIHATDGLQHKEIRWTRLRFSFEKESGYVINRNVYIIYYEVTKQLAIEIVINMKRMQNCQRKNKANCTSSGLGRLLVVFN